MKQECLIWIDRLKNGQTQKIAESLNPSFLDTNEADLKFLAPVQIQGEAYLTNEELILHLKASTKANLPCVICNELITIDLALDSFYHTQPIHEIPSAIFDYQELLREALLLEIPHYVECNQGKCPDRPAITPYLCSNKQQKQEVHFPFSDLGDNHGSTTQ